MQSRIGETVEGEEVMVENNKPAARVSIGVVHATIWRNGKYFSVKIERSYKDGEQWKRTTSFDEQNLLALAKVADMAHTEILRLKTQDRQNDAAENVPEPTEENEGE